MQIIENFPVELLAYVTEGNNCPLSEYGLTEQQADICDAFFEKVTGRKPYECAVDFDTQDDYLAVPCFNAYPADDADDDYAYVTNCVDLALVN